MIGSSNKSQHGKARCQKVACVPLVVADLGVVKHIAHVASDLQEWEVVNSGSGMIHIGLITIRTPPEAWPF